MNVDAYLSERAGAVERALEAAVPPADAPPASIHRAMRHSLFAGGKRIRPILFWAAAETVAGDAPAAVGPACALELIHTYSLIHDDLPALDDDDFRRGRPTCHKVFGEAVAILAGDALLTRAFQLLAETPGVEAERRVRLTAELARAAGTVDGMIGGQVVDLESEGRPLDAELLSRIHRAKTGALLTAAVRMGAIWAGAAELDLARLSQYGAAVGHAFQIVDDILDVTRTSAELGKTAGKDAAQRKATYPALYGVEESRRLAAERLATALAGIEEFGARAEPLRALARRIVDRSA